jgi:hypothetical protein
MSSQALHQRESALERANQIRLARSGVKREIYAGWKTVTDAFDLDCCQSATVFALLRSQKGVGVSKAREVLRIAQVGEGRQVRDLTERQRATLAAIADLSQRRRTA